MYKAIVFDLGNVLLNFDYQIVVNSLNDIELGLGDRFEKLYYKNYHFHKDLETDKISVKDFTGTMLQWLNNKVTAEQFYHIYSDIFSPNEKMVALLPKLKQNYKLFLLSNTNYIHQKYGWENCNFLKYFDKLIVSHEVKARKPEAAIFKAAEKIMGCNSPEIFFTDDILEFVNAAKVAGWDAVQFLGYDNLLEEMKRKNIL